jgi:hypothetical protein
MPNKQSSQKRKASSAEVREKTFITVRKLVNRRQINPQPAQKLKITMKSHAVNATATAQADQGGTAAPPGMPLQVVKMLQGIGLKL